MNIYTASGPNTMPSGLANGDLLTRQSDNFVLTWNGTAWITPGNIPSGATAPYLVSGAPPASTSTAAIEIGGGVFGGGAGTFSGNAAGTALGINTPAGYTGTMIDVQTNGASKFKVDNNGVITTLSTNGIVIGNTAGTTYIANNASGWYFAQTNQQILFLRNGPALGQGIVEITPNGQAAGNDFSQLQVTAGTITMNASPVSSGVTRLQQVTYSSAAAQTATNASTLLIDGPPIAGTNYTITNPYALRVNTGNSFFGGSATFTNNVTLSGATLSTAGLNLNYAITAVGTGGAPTLAANTPTGATGAANKWISIQIQGVTYYLAAWN